MINISLTLRPPAFCPLLLTAVIGQIKSGFCRGFWARSASSPASSGGDCPFATVGLLSGTRGQLVQCYSSFTHRLVGWWVGRWGEEAIEEDKRGKERPPPPTSPTPPTPSPFNEFHYFILQINNQARTHILWSFSLRVSKVIRGQPTRDKFRNETRNGLRYKTKRNKTRSNSRNETRSDLRNKVQNM